jgi:energy-coupling factor transporter transmembrane protein EcfT
MLILIFGVFIEETKYLILALVIFALGIILIYKNKIPYSKIKVLLILICVINITIPYFEQSTPIDFSSTIKECQIKLDSSECRYAYMENGK